MTDDAGTAETACAGPPDEPVGLCAETPAPPGGMVVFGASGDLTARKIVPALFQLSRRGLLPRGFFLVGVARTPMSDGAFRTRLRSALAETTGSPVTVGLDDFLARCRYVAGDYADPATHARIGQVLGDLEAERRGRWNRVFYLATPPTLYAPVVDALAAAGLVAEGEDPLPSAVSVVVEKPFGTDLASARRLDADLRRNLREPQIFRIDHYLGKETVQNVLMLRFANAIFEPIWNRTYVDHVQITVAESLGIGSRAGYYEGAGALRDMFQNHMIQLLTLVAMEPPTSFEADPIRDERVRVLRCLRPLPADLSTCVVRGQYEGYRNEPDVADDSTTETYAAMKIMIDSWRWRGVPFYLRSGKCMRRKLSEIVVTFRQVPHSVFAPLVPAEALVPTTLVLTIQPHEGGALTLQAKHPGAKLCLAPLRMHFCYDEIFGGTPPDAYQRLLLDAMTGDQTLFVRADAMDLSWQFMSPLFDDTAPPLPVHPYAPGTDGPGAADDLLRRDRRCWRSLVPAACP